MSTRSFWTLCVLITAAALAIVPGAMSSSSGATADDDALATALGYLDDSAADLGVTSADFADVFVMSRVTSKHNGVTHFNFNQRFRGLEVFGGHVTVSVDVQRRPRLRLGNSREPRRTGRLGRPQRHRRGRGRSRTG